MTSFAFAVLECYILYKSFDTKMFWFGFDLFEVIGQLMTRVTSYNNDMAAIFTLWGQTLDSFPAVRC